MRALLTVAGNPVCSTPNADRLDAALSTWSASSFASYHAQRISVAIHTAAAAEILTSASASHYGNTRGRKRAGACTSPAARR